MVHVLISVDLEGISGVVSPDHTRPGHAEYQRFRRLMTAEANAAVAGAIEGGATTVVVNDSHAGMDNILIEELDPAARLISGSPKPFGMMQGIGPGVDAVFLVGYHARSGTAAAVHEHTWSGTVVDVQLNGAGVGELGLNAALAGGFGAPVVLVTGDRATAEEARALLGDVRTVVTKEGITRTSAECRHPTVVQAEIRQAAREALASSVPPLSLAAPIAVRVAFSRALHADAAAQVAGALRIDGRTVEWRGDEMASVYGAFQLMAYLARSVAP
jgi:D-amino peptidase